jgi:Ca-activated chloride channel family protein
LTYQSYWAFLLIVPVLAVAAYRWWANRKKTPSVQFSSVKLVQKVKRSWRSYLSPVPLVLKCLALIFHIVALGRPQEANTKIRRNVEGIDIMIVLDISDSMLIEDMQPNRLEAAKQIIANFVKARTSDRIGFVVFAGEAYTRVPLTLDYPLLLKNVADLVISRNIKMGTAIGVGMATGVARMHQSKAKSRVMIFLTDGENNSGTVDPETGLKMAIDDGIRVYSIGVGKDGDAQLPVYVQDAFGNQIKQYRPIHSTINESLLREFADKTGGRYWRATSDNQLGNAFQTIDQLEKTKVDVDKFTRYTELFQNPLRMSLFFFILSLVLSRSVLRRNP